ncbi:MAG: hypothetical protein PHD76_05830 [Methylacidiphilales bacterium]|nr:hypothetical protein [Candidatus Methylacidiphilales bacterium]
MKRVLWLLLFSLFLPLSLRAEVVSKVFNYGNADPAEVEQGLKQVLSPTGKMVILKPERKVLVQDETAYVETAEAIIKQLAAPRPNVKVEVLFDEDSSQTDRSAGVQWRTGGGGIHAGNRPGPGNSVDINLMDRSTTQSSRSGQFLVVQSGKSASIRVVQEVPFLNYFYQYALDHAYVTPEVHWRSIGSQLSVTPRVVGDRIEVELMPQISALVDAKCEIIDYRDLATVVTVANGSEVAIGGFKGASDEFNRSFFSGGGRNGRTQSSGFRVRASILQEIPAEP